MPFRIGFSPNWDAPIDVGEAETAAQAWQKVCNLQRSDEVIRFIRAAGRSHTHDASLKSWRGNEST